MDFGGGVIGDPLEDVDQVGVGVDAMHLAGDDQALEDADVFGGLTSGAYKLQVRLTETDEVAGTFVQFADIRFATNGVTIIGQPGHSPLLGETAEVLDPQGNDTNDTLATALELGNLMNSDLAAISLSGELADVDDIDWYRTV